MRLLLAEDDAILADALAANLQHAGFEVETADNGAVAEYLLMRQQFDAAILDIGLPMVDGLTVLKRVRSARPGQPILVLTAGADEKLRVGRCAARDEQQQFVGGRMFSEGGKRWLRRTRDPLARVNHDNGAHLARCVVAQQLRSVVGMALEEPIEMRADGRPLGFGRKWRRSARGGR